jgi:ABC-type taurine transport system ATPase subunit
VSDGCGKTSIQHMIAGFEFPLDGCNLSKFTNLIGSGNPNRKQHAAAEAVRHGSVPAVRAVDSD